ncbi:nuclear envelope pore membrane protein POM 121-like isoform X2 [Centruroides vittatus]|uniref:nuclear envelope pore membrane protein POM 121-like isoform X2 n=1 Tax=Centruroides vittatus TaxID=120091 RepID=UPI00350EDE73
MLLYVYRRLIVIGGLLFLSLWYLSTFMYSLIAIGVYISGITIYVRRRSRKESTRQLGLARYQKRSKQKFVQNQKVDLNHSNSNDYYNHKEIDDKVKHRNVQHSLSNSEEVGSTKTKYPFNNFRYKAPALENALRMTLTARRRYPTHQERYSLIGQFPIVQLSKESLPVLKNYNTSMMSNQITVKIAPPDNFKPSFSRWKFIYSLPDKEKTKNDPCDARTVIAALKETRKRSSREKDGSEPKNSKRQRRDSNSSSGSAFTPTNQPSAGLTSIPNSELSSNIQKRPSTPESSNLSINIRSKRTKNNEISSSYSSSRRIMEKMQLNSSINQSAKRRGSSLDPVTPNKIIKVTDNNQNSSGEVIQKIEEGNKSQISEEKANENVEKISESNSSMTIPTTLKKGISYRRNLPIYTSLGTHIQTAPIPAHLPTLEEHNKDKKIEEKRLEWLLSGVKEACKNKDCTKKDEPTEIATNTAITTTSFSIANTMFSSVISVTSSSSVPTVTSSTMVTETTMANIMPISTVPSLTFGKSTASIVTSPEVTQLPVSVVQSDTTSSAGSSLFSFPTPIVKKSEKELSAKTDTVTSSSESPQQVSLSSSTITTDSISVPISSPGIKPNFGTSNPVSFSSTNNTSVKNTNTVPNQTSTATIFSGLNTSISLTTSSTSATTMTPSTSGGLNFSLQPINFQFSSESRTPSTATTNTTMASTAGFQFSLTTSSTSGISSFVSSSSPGLSSFVTTSSTVLPSSNQDYSSFCITTNFITQPNSLVTTTIPLMNAVTQSSFTSGNAIKPFSFGATNNENSFLTSNVNQLPAPVSTTGNTNVFGTAFGSPTPLVPSNASIQNMAATSNQSMNNNLTMAQTAIDTPNKTINLFSTGNTFSSNVNPFGMNTQTPVFGQSQTAFGNPNTTAIVTPPSQSQIPKFASNQSTFGSGNTSQSAFMLSGQMQPLFGATNNTFSASGGTFGSPVSTFTSGNSNTSGSTPFQFGSNTSGFNFNFTPTTKYNFGTLPAFGTQPTPSPTPGQGGTLFSIGSGKMERKSNSFRRRTTKK